MNRKIQIEGDSILERFAACETDITVLNAMLKTFLDDDDQSSVALGFHKPILRSIRRAEEERDLLRRQYEDEGKR